MEYLKIKSNWDFNDILNTELGNFPVSILEIWSPVFFGKWLLNFTQRVLVWYGSTNIWKLGLH